MRGAKTHTKLAFSIGVVGASGTRDGSFASRGIHRWRSENRFLQL